MWLGVEQPQTAAKVTKVSLGPGAKGQKDREEEELCERMQSGSGIKK